MNKELEALYRLKMYADCCEGDFISNPNEDYEIVEKELKRLEELEKAFGTLSKDDEKAKKLLSLEIEKNRAFEIIKDKRVNVNCIISGWSLGKYNSYKSHINLTQEEYDLLKEMVL